MNKKGSNTCRITLGVKLGIVSGSLTVPAVKGFPLAPASTANYLSALLDDEIRAIPNELFIDPKDRPEG
jgi:hypothetical protein